MALEQWEIDLRQQLEGDNPMNNPTNKQSWEDIISGEMLSKKSEKTNSENNTMLMMALLFLLGLALLFAYDAKSEGKVQSLLFGKPSDDSNVDVKVSLPIVNSPKIQEDDIASLRADFQKWSVENAEKNDKLTNKVQWNHDRLALMGMLLNENFSIIHNNYDKDQLVFFNRNWTFNHMPKYIELTDSDKEYLRKFEKNNPIK